MKISLTFVPKYPIHNILALVHIIAWCRLGAKPLSEPMMVSLLTHICITQPQWVNCSININFHQCSFHITFRTKSWHEKAFCTTSPLCGNPLVTRKFPNTWPVMQGFDVLFLCYWSEQADEQTIELPVIWDTMMSMWHHWCTVCMLLLPYCKVSTGTVKIHIHNIIQYQWHNSLA